MGIVYLIQPDILKGTSRYKIGCSKSSDFTRLQNGYKAGTQALMVIGTNDPYKLETIIKKEFDKKFNNYSGREFYEGDGNEMIDVFNEVAMKFHRETRPFKVEVKPREEIEESKEEDIVINEKEVLKETTEDNTDDIEAFVPSLKKFEYNLSNDCYEKRIIYNENVFTISIQKDKWGLSTRRCVSRWLHNNKNPENIAFPYGSICKCENVNIRDIKEYRCEFCGKQCVGLQTKRRHMKICKHRKTNIC